MTDLEYLDWLKERLINVYRENPNVDFVQTLDRVSLNYQRLDAQVRNAEYFWRSHVCGEDYML